MRMFYHPGLLSDNFTGAGFAAGTQILSAVPTNTLPNSGNFTTAMGPTGGPAIDSFDTFDSPTSAPGIAT
jgi:hypothetical protein